MMNEDYTFHESTPLGSLVGLPEETRLPLLVKFYNTPQSVRSVLQGGKSGAYLRGLIREFDLSLEQAPKLAFLVLQVGIGDKKLQDLSGGIGQELGVSADQAQVMAKDIEKELFVPVMADLGGYLARKDQKTTDKGEGSKGDPLKDMPNMLDLRDGLKK